MKLIAAMMVLLIITLAGNLISILIGGMLPGSVLGMVILFFLLIFRVIKLDLVEKTSLSLVSYLPLFILPGAISIMKLNNLEMKDIGLIFIVASVSTILTLTVTMLVTELLLKAAGETDNE
jgi:holin-like protein